MQKLSPNDSRNSLPVIARVTLTLILKEMQGMLQTMVPAKSAEIANNQATQAVVVFRADPL